MDPKHLFHANSYDRTFTHVVLCDGQTAWVGDVIISTSQLELRGVKKPSQGVTGGRR